MAGPPADFNYFLAQKYANLRQEADATTASAAANTQNAASSAIQSAAAARNLDAEAGLTGVKANLLPGESQAQVGLTRAQTSLVGNQAAVVIPTSQAQIRGLDATTAGQIQTNQIQFRNGLGSQLHPGSIVDDSAPASPAAFGAGGYTGPRLGAPTYATDATVAGGPGLGIAPIGVSPTAQRPGESYAAWTSRIRGAGF